MGMTKQFIITPAMGKRLIAKGLAACPAIIDALKDKTIVIIAGTTNGYVAQEILTKIGAADDFARMGFRRGIVTPPGFDTASVKAQLAGDVVIASGAYQQGKTIFDVANDLGSGDVILKGANAVNLRSRQAGLYIANPQLGTIGAALPAIIGRRARLIVPVGVEKRVEAEITDIEAMINDPDTEGPRMFAMPGEVYTELDAIEDLTEAEVDILAGGGIYGAEGCVWVGVTGDEECLSKAQQLIESVSDEPACEV